MDLLAFIRHANPTKVKVGEKEAQDGEVPLLELTKDRVVPLAGVYDRGNANVQGAGNDDVNEGVNDVTEDGQAKRGDRVVDIRGIEIVANDEISAIPKKVKKKRKVTDGAGGLGLLERSTLAAEIGVTAAANVPFVTSFMTPRLEHKGGGGEDSTAGLIIHTRPAPERSSVPSPPVLTVAVTTTVAPGATFVLVRDLGVRQVNPDIFRDFASLTTPRQVYIPKWNVINDFVLDDPYVCRGMIDHLAPPRFFFQLWAMDYQKLLTEYSEDEAAEAICLCGQIATVEAMKATRITQLNSLRERNVSLEGQVSALEFAVSSKDVEIASSVSGLKVTCSGLRDEVMGYKLFKERLEEMQDKEMKVLSHRVATIDSNLMEMVLHMDAEFYPRYLTTIVERRWILSRGLRLVLAKCLALPKYLSAMGEAIGRAIDKCMQDGLTVGIEHERDGRSIADVAAFNPFVEGDYVAAINALRDVNFLLLAQLEASKDSSMADIMDLLRLEGPAIESFEASQLQPSPEQLMVPIHRDATARCLSLTDSILPLVKPLSARNLTGEARSSAALATAVTTSLLTTFAQINPVPSMLSTKVPPSPRIIFEEEELDTASEDVLAP
nr:hypothetical protein [Tanacetum cinerariifolium]